MAPTPNDYSAQIQSYPSETLPETSENNPVFDRIDTDKIRTVITNSWLWVLLIILVCLAIGYLTQRYTKPVYESISDLKLNFKSEASMFGFSNFSETPNLNYLSGEIELMRSRLFFSQVINSLPLEISYFTKGRFLDDEKYRDSPIEATATIRQANLYNTQFLVTIIDEDRYTLLFPWQTDKEQATEHYFGETISTEGLDIRLEATHFLDPKYYGTQMYFIIHDEAALLGYIANKLDVRPLNVNAHTIRISFQDHNRVKARDLVKAITTIYQTYTQDQKKQANQQKIEFLNEQLLQTETKLDEYEQYFENFTIRNRTTNLNEDLQVSIQQMMALDTLLGQARARQKGLNQLYAQLIDTGYAPSGSAIFPGLNPVLNKLHTVQEEHARLLLSHDPRTMIVRRTEQQLTTQRDAVLDEVELLQAQLDEEISDLVRQRARMEQSFVQLPAKGTEYNQAERFYKLYEEFYLTLMQRRAEFEIAQAGTTTEFVVLTPATLNNTPILPNRILIMGLAFFAAIGLSIALIAIRYLLHNTVTSVSEVEKLTQMPMLGGVPILRNEKMAHTQMVISRNPKSSLSEAFRSIRTNMDFLLPDKKIKTISVTSTISGEGKTFVSVNLGGIISLSKQKVIIVDLDMRRPRVHLAFGDENPDRGVSTVLINRHELGDCVRPTDFENLHYIPVGPTPPNPSELLLSPAFTKLMRQLKEQYDVVVLDTPPVGLVTDGVLVMKIVDLPIYVFRADYSKRVFAKTVQRMRKVNKFNNMAVILNAIKTNTGQGYGYGYGYTYGYYEDGKGSSTPWYKKLWRR